MKSNIPEQSESFESLSPTHSLKHELRYALGLLFGFTFLLALIQLLVPFLSGFMQVALAFALLEIPPWLLKRGFLPAQRELFTQIGSYAYSAKLTLWTTVLVLVPFFGAHHLVQTELFERTARWEVSRLARWSEDLEYQPAKPCAPASRYLWAHEGRLWLSSPTASTLEVQLQTTPPLKEVRLLSCREGRLHFGEMVPLRPDGRLTLAPQQGLFAQLDARTQFELSLEGAGQVPLRLGSKGIEASESTHYSSSRDYWWILAFILIHVFLVAWPEEYFFRGYLMPRLDSRFGRPWRWLGVQVGWGLILSSLAFALLHPILIPGAHRLLVFFPALLFGWLVLKQQGLGAAIAVHALCNLAQALIIRMYG